MLLSFKRHPYYQTNGYRCRSMYWLQRACTYVVHSIARSQSMLANTDIVIVSALNSDNVSRASFSLTLIFIPCLVPDVPGLPSFCTFSHPHNPLFTPCPPSILQPLSPSLARLPARSMSYNEPRQRVRYDSVSGDDDA